MKWEIFVSITRHLPCFGEAVLLPQPKQRAMLRNQLSAWVKSGRLWRLKKGLYTLPPAERRIGLSLNLASNLIYSPSYVSLEYMLSFYGLIPEQVKIVTAVSTRKTARFRNQLGAFTYRHLKQKAFAGFIQQADEFGSNILVASAEKALLDKLYLDTKGDVSKEYLRDGLRLQNTQLLRLNRLKQLAMQFSSKKLQHAVSKIWQVRQEEI